MDVKRNSNILPLFFYLDQRHATLRTPKFTTKSSALFRSGLCDKRRRDRIPVLVQRSKDIGEGRTNWAKFSPTSTTNVEGVEAKLGGIHTIHASSPFILFGYFDPSVEKTVFYYSSGGFKCCSQKDTLGCSYFKGVRSSIPSHFDCC